MAVRAQIQSCVVVGAGVAGLTASRTLRQRGVAVTVLEKSKALGGRLATRRIDDGVFDHGAQFLTARHAAFQKIAGEWESAGVIREWCRGFPDQAGPRLCDGHPCYKGVGGMTAIPKYLGRDLDVRLGTRAVALATDNGKWTVQTDGSGTFSADALILTPPAPQAVELLSTANVSLDPRNTEILKHIEYDPCLAVLLLLSHPSAVPEPGGVRITDGPLAFIADNHQKGISPNAAAVTIHASAEFSRKHWGDEDPTVARLAMEFARQWIEPDHVKVWQVKRWRYSLPIALAADPCIQVIDQPPLILAGDAFGGPRIEGAVLSGLAAAEKLLGHAAGPVGG